jgi:hypothetical protein
MILASELDEALRAAGIPIIGVAIGNGDRSKWRVDFAANATQAQKDAAAALVAAFVEPTDATRLDKQAQVDTNRKELQAVALALWECIPAPTMTKVQLRNRIVALYKTL